MVFRLWPLPRSNPLADTHFALVSSLFGTSLLVFCQSDYIRLSISDSVVFLKRDGDNFLEYGYIGRKSQVLHNCLHVLHRVLMSSFLMFSVLMFQTFTSWSFSGSGGGRENRKTQKVHAFMSERKRETRFLMILFLCACRHDRGKWRSRTHKVRAFMREGKRSGFQHDFYLNLFLR